MQILVTFRHMSPSDPLKAHATERMMRLKKYFDQTVDAHVVLSVEKNLHRADLNLLAHGINMRGEESSSDMYNSIDRAVERIDKQIKKYHSKIVSHRPRVGARMKLKYQTLEAPEGVEINPAFSDLSHIVETKELDARPMMLDEAVMQMDLVNDDVLVFLNVKTDQINVLYRKAENKYGLIEANS